MCTTPGNPLFKFLLQILHMSNFLMSIVARNVQITHINLSVFALMMYQNLRGKKFFKIF